jgi:hypothetical protein
MARPTKIALPLAQATYAQYQAMEQAGLADLDKSGIAELTFPGRGPKKAKTKKAPQKKR